MADYQDHQDEEEEVLWSEEEEINLPSNNICNDVRLMILLVPANKLPVQTLHQYKALHVLALHLIHQFSFSPVLDPNLLEDDSSTTLTSQLQVPTLEATSSLLDPSSSTSQQQDSSPSPDEPMTSNEQQPGVSTDDEDEQGTEKRKAISSPPQGDKKGRQLKIFSITEYSISNEEISHDSASTEKQDNTMDKPEYSRVDVQITVNPHTDPEEETKLVLQQFLLELQKYDSKVAFAPWNETSMLESW
eukprot:CAMPEP_0184870428 /NCGR_PEP_ID=MMETSP0580-20130426/37412_1 /TAXON_ID=1118495 /ORGANISM="Dactyliosolen fragilissimus" /LENGTH=245 /DNA_ID=CAMNT_0027372479 /DNA_START=1030 /DNA_END=1765 /DNA_ORIENTATION=-